MSRIMPRGAPILFVGAAIGAVACVIGLVASPYSAARAAAQMNIVANDSGTPGFVIVYCLKQHGHVLAKVRRVDHSRIECIDVEKTIATYQPASGKAVLSTSTKSVFEDPGRKSVYLYFKLPAVEDGGDGDGQSGEPNPNAAPQVAEKDADVKALTGGFLTITVNDGEGAPSPVGSPCDDVDFDPCAFLKDEDDGGGEGDGGDGGDGGGEDDGEAPEAEEAEQSTATAEPGSPSGND